jgi:fucose 4-O-acetylase-like acetyltransferase
MNQMVKSRLHWIDWAKCGGILLVVIAHMPTQFHITGMIFSFHMPLFVVISGYLYKPVGIKTELSRSFQKLIIPYLIYNTILVFLGLFTDCLTIQLPNIQYILLGRQEMLPVSYRAVWFIISIFLLRLLFSVIHTKIQYLSVTVSSILIIYLTKRLSIDPFIDYFQILTTTSLLPFFVLGIYLRKNDKLLNFKGLYLLGIIGVILAYFNRMVNVLFIDYGKNVILFYIVATILSVSFLSVMKTFFNKGNEFVKNISIGTLFIIGFHQTAISLLEEIIPVTNMAINLAYTTIIMLSSYLFIRILNKYFPLMLGQSRPTPLQ